MSKKRKKTEVRQQLSYQKTPPSVKEARLPFFDRPLSGKMLAIIGCGAVLAAAAGALVFLAVARTQNGGWGFPLDDSWIHLCFARNLVESGRYSYFRDAVATSGSTSPLYTFLLAALYAVSSNEFIISYVLGIVFACLSAYVFWRLASLDFGHLAWCAAAAAFIMALQPKLCLIAVSGMETTLFICCILATLYCYKAANVRGLGIMLGLTLWCRPDGFILWIAVAADYGLRRCARAEEHDGSPAPSLSGTGMLTAFGIALALAAAYGAFNYQLSGRLLPNTYSAKTAYYASQPWRLFLQRDMAEFFFLREFMPMGLFFVVGAGRIVVAALRRRYSPYMVHLVFVLGFLMAYCIKLPYAHRFGRYVMPLIPCYIFISTVGLRAAAAGAVRLLKREAAGTALWLAGVAAMVAAPCIYASSYAKTYTYFCKYHTDRHVAAGKWIAENTPQGSLIATHDIGAIAYYGRRRILDMAGLVTPEITPHLQDEKFELFLEDYLAKNGVTHLAVLTSWFEIANSRPLFAPVHVQEVIEVHAFVPGRTHLLSREVSSLNRQAMQRALKEKNYEAGMKMLQYSYRLDPKASPTLFYLGVVSDMMGNTEEAAQYFQQAVSLFPEYPDALLGLAREYVKLGRVDEARAAAQECLGFSPGLEPARLLLEGLAKQVQQPR